MKTKLEVLKNYLDYVIEHKEEHYWNCPKTCHCGMLLNALDLFNHLDIYDVYQANSLAVELDLGEHFSTFYRSVFLMYKDTQCSVTELSFTKVVEKLTNYGFTLDELVNLEHLQDKRFMDISPYDRNLREVDSLIQYLTNWINYEEQLVKATTKTKDTVPVMVAE